MNFKANTFIRMAFACVLLLGAYGAAATIAFKPGDACAAAGAAPATPCDPQYMDALEARAWLEAQREISQNQNLILKPDSVLEYSCFERFLWEIGDHAAQMFSETTRWGPITGLGPTSQDQALGNLILTGLVDYIANNFPHDFLSGRAVGIDHDPNSSPTAPGGYTYECDRLAAVWEAAKCMNFFDDPATDGFYDFRWYQTDDPRSRPPGLAECTTPAAPYAFENMQQIGFNGRQDMFVLATENPMDAAGYNRDNLVTFLNFILPRGVDPATSCTTTPIRTGIMVNRRMGGGEYPDGVCPNPGCYLTADGASCN